jgi:hypothetical protein
MAAQDEVMEDVLYTEEPSDLYDQVDQNTANVTNDDSPPCSQSSNSIPMGSPASSLRCSQASNASSTNQTGRRLYPAQFQREESIRDAIRYPMRTERYFHEHDLMVPKDRDLDSIEANEKSWTMVRPTGPSVTDGISWSFVDICSGLSSELLKVCHFFEVMNGLSNLYPWNGVVVPTTDISSNSQTRNLCLKYNKKEVIGVIDSKYVETTLNLSLSSSDRRGVDTGKLLRASEMNSAGTQHTLLPLFKIHVGFTAAFFKADQPNAEGDEEAEDRQATFGVVTITNLRNVDSLKLIVVRSSSPLARNVIIF